MGSIPVLMYHHVNPLKGDMVTVTPGVFEAQMKCFRDGGYAALGCDELFDFMEGKYEPHGKAAVVTFDDGYLDNYVYAWPILKAYGIKAVIFVTTGWLDKATAEGVQKGKLMQDFRKAPPSHGKTKAMAEQGRYSPFAMDWGMAREMASSGLVEIQSHTVTHGRCDGLSPEDLRPELVSSKEAVEKNIGKPCRYLCWPKGKYNASAVETAKQAGYRALFTTSRGIVKKGDDPYAIKRIVVKDGAGWLKTRLRIYTSPLLSSLYLGISKKGR